MKNNFSEDYNYNEIISMLKDIGLLISKSFSFNEMLKVCLDYAIKISKMDCGGIYLVDDDNNFDLVIHKGLPEDFIKKIYHYDNDSISAKSILINQPIYTNFNDLTLYENDKLLKENLKALAVIPIHHDQKVIGCLNVSSFELNEIPEYTRNALETISGFIGGSILMSSVTERLKESDKKYKDLIDGINEGFYITDEAGKLIFLNKGLADIFCYDSVEEMIGEVFTKFIDIDNKEKFYNIFKNSIGSGKFNELLEVPIIKKDGSNGFIKLRAIPLFDGEGKIVGAQGIMSDITAQKEYEIELKRLNEELEIKNKELEELIYVASHDLRTPLVNIKGFANELYYSIERLYNIFGSKDCLHCLENEKAEVDDYISHEIPEYINFIKHSVVKMDSLISGILKISRVGRVTIDKSDIEMNKLLGEIINTFEFQLKSKNIKIAIDDLPNCLGDQSMMNQVFSNLVDNAIKYLDPNRGSNIKITGEKKGRLSIYCIEDNGIGISEINKEKVFEIFHRIEPEKTSGEGLGLNIVKKMLNMNNGKIWVESQEGIGSKFFVSLPSTNFKE